MNLNTESDQQALREVFTTLRQIALRRHHHDQATTTADHFHQLLAELAESADHVAGGLDAAEAAAELVSQQ